MIIVNGIREYYNVFWFIISVILLILLLKTRDNAKKVSDTAYGQGYWDGFRAFGDKVRELLKEPTIDKKKLNQLINEGEGIGVSEDGSASKDAAAEVVEEASPVPATPAMSIATEVDQSDDARIEQEVLEESPVQHRKLSSKQLAAEKERVTLRNLNTLLYMGSFLLVAAAATFIAAAMPEMVRLVGLIIVVALFYLTGIILHIRVPRLRPAAIAFTGTGLAILPFVGIALTMLGGVEASVAWLSVSIVGLIAYGCASVVLQSQVVSYLTMAFVLSLASATVATAQVSIMWYFIALVGVSLIAASIGNLWPNRVPKIFLQPIETTGQVITPVALVASLFVADKMELYMYEVLFGLGAAHYLVVWLQKREYLYEVIVRVLSHVALLLIGWDIIVPEKAQNTTEWFGLWWMILILAQAAYSIVRIKTKDRQIYQSETVQLIVAQVGLAIAPVFWLGFVNAAALTTLNFIALAIVSFATAYRLKNENWGYVGLFSLWVLPLMVGRQISNPAWPWETFIVLYTVLAGASLAGYKWVVDSNISEGLRKFFTIATAVYAATTICIGIVSEESVLLGWALVVSGGIAAAYSYIGKVRQTEVFGVALIASGVFTWIVDSTIHSDWRGIVAILGAMSVAGVATLIHQIYRDDEWRRNALLILTIICGGILWIAGVEAAETTKQAVLVLLLAGTLASLGVRVIAQQVNASMKLQSILTAAYMSYLILAWLASFFIAETGFVAAVYIIAALVLWAGSHIERQPATLLIGNISLLTGMFIGWQWLEFASQWQTFGVLWAVAFVYSILYAIYVQSGDSLRQWIQILSAWSALIVAVTLNMVVDSQYHIASIATLIGSGLLLIFHGYRIYKDESQARALRLAVGTAVCMYVFVGIVLLVQNASIAGWAFALVAIFSAWYSYLSRQVAAEVLGGCAAIVAIAAWLSAASLGIWYISTVILVAVAVLLLVVFFHNVLKEANRRDGMLGLALVVFAGFILNAVSASEEVRLLSALALAAGTIVTFGARCLQQDKEARTTLSQLFTGSYVLYVLLAWLISWSLASGWHIAISALAAIIIWSASHVEKVPALVLVGQALLAIVVTNMWRWLELDTEWMVFGVAWIVASLYYVAYWVYATQKDVWRQTASFASTLTALVVAMALGLSYSDTPREIAVAATFIVAAVIAGIHGYIRRSMAVVEIAIYSVAFGLQRISGLLIPEINGVVYAHWWAIVIAIVAFWRNQFVGRRLAVAMGILTLTLTGYALQEGGIYQMLFLVEHIVLLIAGALLRKQWAVWWGIIASVGAILYFIKDYTFLWLGVLGLSLIALVVWRLTKIGKSEER